jgi:hypothetical protein
MHSILESDQGRGLERPATPGHSGASSETQTRSTVTSQEHNVA